MRGEGRKNGSVTINDGAKGLNVKSGHKFKLGTHGKRMEKLRENKKRKQTSKRTQQNIKKEETVRCKRLKGRKKTLHYCKKSVQTSAIRSAIHFEFSVFSWLPWPLPGPFAREQVRIWQHWIDPPQKFRWLQEFRSRS